MPLAARLTNFYQITMTQAYFALRMHDTAVFELFARHLLPRPLLLLSAGLQQALHYLEELHFSARDIDFLDTL